MNKETWQLVDTGCELWPKRTKKSTHLNVSCFDPILSNGNTSANGGKKTPNQPKVEGRYQKMAHPTCRQAYTKYMCKHTKGLPMIQRRTTILFSDPMLKERVKNKNPLRVAAQQKRVVARSAANISKWCKSGVLHLCHAATFLIHQESLNTYGGQLGTRHSEKWHCPAQLLATARIARDCVGDMPPAVLVPDSPLTRRGGIRV